MTRLCNTARWLAVLAFSTLSLQAGAAPADKTSAASSAEATYQREVAYCNQSSTPQGRSTCLKEAGAARAEASRKQLDNGESAEALRRNAELRCQNVATDERESCLRMARGEGEVSGSVDGGGVMKTLVTPVPAPAASTPLPAASH